MMNRRPKEIGERTKAFALRIIRLYAALPKTTEAQVLGKQILRSGTSVGAHVREGKRSRSDAELISKIEGGLQELEDGLLAGITWRIPHCQIRGAEWAYERG